MNLLGAIIKKIYRIINCFYYKLKLKHVGCNTLIDRPINIIGANNIIVGKNVTILKGVHLGACALSKCKSPKLVIGNNCTLNHFNEIFAVSSIVLEDHVLTADRVYITDNIHGYEDPSTPIKRQPIETICKEVRIGEGSWLGINVCVLGASIGKHCVIGSNAVVTSDIPDYCVAVGMPARIIKRYDFDCQEWRKTNPDGTFK